MKRRIVEHLGCYRTCAEVPDLIRQEFGVEVTPRHVRMYDPASYQFTAATRWREYHAQARKRFEEEIAGVAIAHRAVRLRQLDMMFHQAMDAGNLQQAAACLEQAAKEVGDMYVGRR